MKNANDARRAAAVAVLLAGVVYALHFLGIVFCPLRRWTGLPCPACGTVRASLKLLGGDVAGAFALQPLGLTVLVAGFLAFALAFFFPAFACRGLGIARRHVRALVVFAALAVAANWTYVIWTTLCKR